MFNFSDNDINNIGEKNVQAVKETLKRLNIPILASDTGGDKGRTMIVDLRDFAVSIRLINREIIQL